MTWTIEQMCKIAALTEIKDGMYINLGIGIPTKVANYIPSNIGVTLQSENGMLGIGPYPDQESIDPDLINAGKEPISEQDGCSYFDSCASFGMIRGGHIDLSILGAMEVSQSGDLANWMIPGKMLKGMGGAMDLVVGVKRIVVIMEHNSKNSGFKLVKKCSLPLTGAHVVSRIITNLGIFDINRQLELVAINSQTSIEQISRNTQAEFIVNINQELQSLLAEYVI
jgi:3-oxoacid CoA-transferase subunit B